MGGTPPTLKAPTSDVGLRIHSIITFLLVCLILTGKLAAQPQDTLITYLQDQLGLTAVQARGALGALLVYAHQRLTPQDFTDLAKRVPNAQNIMQGVKLQGIVTHPLKDRDDYEATLQSLGIGQPLASQVAPTVLAYLAATGHDREHDILSGIF